LASVGFYVMAREDDGKREPDERRDRTQGIPASRDGGGAPSGNTQLNEPDEDVPPSIAEMGRSVGLEDATGD
jgi:hypothetical protein